MNYCIVTPWHNPEQKDKFLEAWGIKKIQDWLILQQDKNKEGCAVVKNKGIEEALQRKAEVVIVLDDDCYPLPGYAEVNRSALETFCQLYLISLAPQLVKLYQPITHPPSRGTPYLNQSMLMSVAASMGFWTVNPDYDAATQLALRKCDFTKDDIVYFKEAMFWRFFPFSGMNCAFRSDFWPFFKFDETAERYDDIFMGYRLQAEAYKRGYCINLQGPLVRHVRQSNVWNNLKIEAENMERNETEWQKYV